MRDGDHQAARPLRIATWNLERPSLRSWQKLPAQLQQITAVDADIWGPLLDEFRASGATVADVEDQYQWHALPVDWEKMEYRDFLAARRALMASVIRRAFSAMPRA